MPNHGVMLPDPGFPLEEEHIRKEEAPASAVLRKAGAP